MRSHSRVLGAATLFLAVVFFMPHIARAADINLDPETATHPADEEFKVKIIIDPSGQNVNASDGTVTFDTDILSVSGVSKEGSAFSLWTSDPTFSNSAGTVSFSGGTPSPFSKSGAVVTITFKGKKPGTGKVAVTKGSVLAADGKGTDVYKNGGTASYTITEAKAEAPAEEEGGAVGPIPLAPNITSPTHPKEDQWYATSTAVFNWSVLDEDTGTRVLLSQNENDTPGQPHTLKKVATTSTMTNMPEGVSYFFVQLKNDSGWGAVGKKKIQIDTIPPKSFEVALLDGAIPKLAFKTEDEGVSASGMDRYEIVLGSAVAATVKAADVTDGAPVPPQEGGEQTVTIRAYDKANNKTEATKQLKLPKVAKPTASDAPAQPPFWTTERIFLILFAMIIGALIAWIIYTRRNADNNKSMLLHRVHAMGDKNDRVFQAMREEFEAMIHTLDPKPQLTPSERQFLEDTKEVLDLAEEQVGAGVDELKKLLRGQ